jgi:hypothetical protein
LPETKKYLVSSLKYSHENVEGRIFSFGVLEYFSKTNPKETMKISFSNLALGLTMFAVSCEDDPKIAVTMETKVTNPGADLVCYCTEVDYSSDKDVTYGYSRLSTAVEQYVEKGNNCEKYGYIFKDASNGNRNYDGPNGGTQPGASGYFGGGTSGSSGTAGSGSKPSYCSTPYSSLTSDAQLNALCGAVYAYRCSGNAAAADFTCTQYKIIPQTGSNVKCPYCN